MFATFAKVEAAKPGAQILAVHPTACNPASGAPAILMASQDFGKGRAMVLATDSLWRWKLSLPSESREVESFWQQLLGWLAQPSLEGLHFVKPKFEIAVGKPAKFILEGCRSSDPPVVVARGDDTRTERVTVTRQPTGTCEANWMPGKTGRWLVSAKDGSGAEASVPVEVIEAPATLETSNLPADIELMQRVAAQTGGELLQNEIPASWRHLAVPPKSRVISEQVNFLWNQWPILLACLGCYAMELILRRRWKAI
jgi:hypothetical protein